MAIAGVIAMQPHVLILDEPTAGLDPKGRDEILSLITRLHQERNTTIVLVSHSMDDVARLANRLIVMAQGKVVFDDTPSSVFAHADYLEEIGLGVPQVTRLLQELSKHGFAIRTDLYTIEDAEGEIVKILETK